MVRLPTVTRLRTITRRFVALRALTATTLPRCMVTATAIANLQGVR